MGRLDLTLAPDPSSVAEARARVVEAVTGDLGAATADTLRLLVSELVTNAVRHGDGVHPVELHATWEDEVRVEVCDQGRRFAPPARSDGEPGGYGLFLVGSLADRWGVETAGGTTVWFVLRR
jgi:anti-sigma regulatory factor (Ser/Thr protein kinase)